MNQILGELGKSQKFKELLNQIENKQSPIAISGLNDVGAVQIETAINQFRKKPICIITYNEIQAKKIYENVKYFTENVVLFPKKESFYIFYSITDSLSIHILSSLLM